MADIEKKAYKNLKNIPVPMQALYEAGLSPNQWVLLFMLYFRLWEEVDAYFTGPDAPQGFPPDDLNDLHERFYLIFEPKPGDHPKLSYVNFRVSIRFEDLLHHIAPAWLPFNSPTPALPTLDTGIRNVAAPPVEALEAYDELFTVYPTHIMVQDKLMSARSGDQDKMAEQYAALLLRKDAMPHRDIVDLVEWAKENKLINMGLQRFIASREWIGLDILRNKGHQDNSFQDTGAI